MKLLAICAALAGLVWLAPQALAQSRECRDVTVSEGGSPTRTTMCRDSDGQWRPVTGNAASPIAGQPLAANFRGKITYRGSFDIVAQLPARGRQVPREDREQGTIVNAVEYDGNLVTLNWTTSMGVRQRSGRATGTRQGNQCRLFEDTTQSPYVGTCDAAVFRGNTSNGPTERVSWRGIYDTAATETVDYVLRDRERAEQQRQRAEDDRKRAAEKAQADEAERRRIAAMPKPKFISLHDLINLNDFVKCWVLTGNTAEQARSFYDKTREIEAEFIKIYRSMTNAEVMKHNEATTNLADACREVIRADRA